MRDAERIAFVGTLLLTVLGIGASRVGAECVSPPSGLVAWWPGDGTTDDIAGGRNGSLSGASFAPAKVDQGFYFPPSTQVTVADDSVWTFGDSAFTIDAWVNFESVGSRDAFIGHDEGGGGQNKWIFWYDAGGHRPPYGPALRFHINIPTVASVDAVVYPWNPNPGTWYHVAVTREGIHYALYIDGVHVITETDANSIPDPNAPLTIGNAEGLDFNGQIDEVEIFDRALTDTEIAAIFNAGSAGKCKGPPEERLAALVGDIISLNLQEGIANSLDAKLQSALDALEDANAHNDGAAINKLQSFVNAVNAQRGSKVSEADADALIVAAQAIIDQLSDS